MAVLGARLFWGLFYTLRLRQACSTDSHPAALERCLWLQGTGIQECLTAGTRWVFDKPQAMQQARWWQAGNSGLENVLTLSANSWMTSMPPTAGSDSN